MFDADRDSLAEIPSLPGTLRLARGSEPAPMSRRVEVPTLRIERRMLEDLRSMASDIPSLALAHSIRSYDPDEGERVSKVIVDVDDFSDNYAEITIG